MKIEGIVTALVTPFDAAGEVDEAALRRLVDFQVKGGVNGLFICGHPSAAEGDECQGGGDAQGEAGETRRPLG